MCNISVRNDNLVKNNRIALIFFRETKVSYFPPSKQTYLMFRKSSGFTAQIVFARWPNIDEICFLRCNDCLDIGGVNILGLHVFFFKIVALNPFSGPFVLFFSNFVLFYCHIQTDEIQGTSNKCRL